MAQDLTTSPVSRQNILNNRYAMTEIQKVTGLEGIAFEGKTVVFKDEIAAFFEVSTRTIDAYIERHAEELTGNGYEVLRGKRLKSFKKEFLDQKGNEANFVTVNASSQLGIFDFRAFLNIAMLVSESSRAKLLRQVILDVVIDTVNLRTGGGTKYINQRDEAFLQASFSGEEYRKIFTDALQKYVKDNQIKYATYTDKIYECIFLEKSKKYRNIINLEKKDQTRETFYAEILDLIAAFEFGFADALKKKSTELDRPLGFTEADTVLKEFDSQPLWQPLKERARMRMASRDLAFRDALHIQLESYIVPVTPAEFEKFLGEKSKELAERIEDARESLKRLKDR
jgi:hypothetical protein